MKTTSPLLQFSSDPMRGFDVGSASNMQIAISGPAYDGSSGFVVDLSALRKRLVVGNEAQAWIAQHTGTCPDELFAIEPLDDDAYVVRVHRSQYLVADGPDSERFDELFMLSHGRHGDVLVLDYECAELGLGGGGVEDVVAELCPMPVSDLSSNVWCATRMAHTDVVLRVVDRPRRHYRIIVTPADARFVFETLMAAVGERGGHQIAYNNYWQEFCLGGAAA